MIKIDIPPLSSNEAWQGRRFKSDKYKKYERDLLLMLPKIQIPQPPYRITFEFGFSSSLSDWDNPIKPLQDILQKKYKFNDRYVIEAHVKKVKVRKGREYLKFRIDEYLQDQ